MENGQVLTRASAECGHDNPWKQRPHYARRSMAQTRATGKACRLAFSWIMSLAGYSATPYEEVQDITPHNSNSQSTQQKQSNNSKQGSSGQAQKQNTGTQLITQKQMNLLKQQLQLLTTDSDEMKQICNAWLSNNGYGQINSTKELTKNTATKLIDAIKQQVEEQVEQNDPLNKSSNEMDEDPFAEPAEQTE